MRRELSALVARSPFGQGAAWPVVETVQRDGICVLVIAPAPALPDDVGAAAQQLALRLAAELGVVGVLAVELFETVDGALLVNELAMRPHNSGHWTMDGARTSQFEQHLRAVLDYPLGDTDATVPVTVMANVLGAAQTPTMALDERLHHLFARMPEARVHLYGKDERPGRKMATSTSSAPTCPGWQTCVNAPSSRHTGCHTGSGRTDGTHMAEQTQPPRVGVIMGSDSDWSVMADAADALSEFDVSYEVGVVSAHRTPQRMLDYARGAAGRGVEVIIAGAGGAAHLPGMVASATPLPVIGVPVPLARLDGLDSLLSIAQMQAGYRWPRCRSGGRATQACWRCAFWRCRIRRCAAGSSAFQEQLAESVLAKDAALKERQGKVTGE